MNCEQRYNNALKRARIGLHDCNLLDCDNMTRKAVITTIYHLFPELAEDEDERIRKGIIRNLQYLMDRSEGFVKEDLQKRIAWLEKQGESTITNIEIPFWANDSELQEVSYNIPEGFYAEIKDDRVVIKKVEPEFHEEDWIISNDKKSTYQVIEVKRCIYVIRDNVDNHEYHIGIEECEKSGRLWSINDANDGDVLVDEDNNIGIFQECEGICWHSYIYLGCDGKLRGFSIGGSHEQTDTCPATKEQRDLLFSKIKQAGYEWVADKKELKKI